jgi:FtsH-binding integral membrane protein
VSYQGNYRTGSVITGTVDDRVTFIRKTYTHLAGAIGLFVLFSWAFQESNIAQSILNLIATAPMAWFLFIGGFALVGYMAQNLARADRPLSTQYMGLGLYTLGEALLFSPMILLASLYGAHNQAPNILADSAIVTLCTFAGLSGYVIIYNKDFSFLGGFLAAACFTALGVIIVAILFGLNLGVWFSGAMILIASVSILYSTSKVLKYYRSDQYVAAALELFAAIALLFWYVLRLFMQMNRR